MRKRTAWKIGLITFGVIAAVALPALLMLKLDEDVFWPVLAVAGVMAAGLGISSGTQRTIPLRVKIVDKSRGIIRLRFRNEDYRKLIQMYERGLS